jgi:hypothetical protein
MGSLSQDRAMCKKYLADIISVERGIAQRREY